MQLFVWEAIVWLTKQMLFPTDGANWWYQKSSVSHTVLTYSRQHLRNKNKKDLVESTDVVLVKYPPKIKLENSHNSKVPEFGEIMHTLVYEDFGVFIVA